jgi:ABC-type nitrate/sulfonate/bicarbonate transport system permease component
MTTPNRTTAIPLRGLLPLAALLTAWQLVGDDRSLSFPPPNEWLAALGRLHDAAVLLPALTFTLTTYLAALLLATVAGTALGIVIGSSRRVDRALTPSLDVLATVPGAAILPVVVLLLGPGRPAAVAVVALAVGWPVLITVTTAMRNIPTIRIEVGRTLGLSPAARRLRIVLPTLAPAILLSMRMASSMALIVTLLNDIVGTGDGVGRLLVAHQQQFDAAAVWGLLLTIGVFGYLVSAALAAVEQRRSRLGR